MAQLSSNTIKYIKTFDLYCCFFALGLCMAIPGPTLIDLTHTVNTDVKHITLLYTASAVGAIFGSVVSGAFFDNTNKKQVILTIFNLVMAVCLLGIPWSRSIYILAVWMSFNGIAIGVLHNVGNIFCLNLWGKKSGPYYQALHFMFAFGGTVAPLVAAPFLGKFPAAFETNGTKTENISHAVFQSSNFKIHSTFPTVTYAYSIIGIFTFIVTIMFLITSFISPVDENVDTEKAEKSTDVSKINFYIYLLLVLLASILILTTMGTESGYAQMLTTYANKGPLHLVTLSGSYLTSTYWASFTASRLVGVFLAIKISNLAILILDIIMLSIGSVILVFLAPHYEWGLWVSSLILGLGIASFYPSTVSWLDEHIPVTEKIISIFTIVAMLGAMFFPFIISYFIVENPDVFLYINVASCIVAILVMIVMYLILKKIPQRFVTPTSVSDKQPKSNN